jgi:hypothetical protein
LLVGRDDTLRSVNGSIPRGGGGDTAISGGVTRVAETQNLETKSPADQNATPENGGYEYVIIFDADFDPHPGFIRKVRVGPFQTPNQKTDCLRVQHWHFVFMSIHRRIQRWHFLFMSIHRPIQRWHFVLPISSTLFCPSHQVVPILIANKNVGFVQVRIVLHQIPPTVFPYKTDTLFYLS